MKCYYCNRESISTAATGSCIVCQCSTCSHPSGRTDNRFHGEKCRFAKCGVFVCEYDAHSHSHAAGGPSSLPELDHSISADFLHGASNQFGHRYDAPLSSWNNRAFTRYLSFLFPAWRYGARTAGLVTDEMRRNGKFVAPIELTAEYFDAVRVAQCIDAALRMYEFAKKQLVRVDIRSLEVDKLDALRMTRRRVLREFADDLSDEFDLQNFEIRPRFLEYAFQRSHQATTRTAEAFEEES